LPGVSFFGDVATFFPDSKRILFRGIDSSRSIRLYVLDLESGKGRPVTPDGIAPVAPFAISPNGRLVVASVRGKGSLLFDVEGGPPQPIPGLPRDDMPIKWCADGRSVFVLSGGGHSFKVSRVDISSGRSEVWKEFLFTDVGGNGDVRVLPTPDGKSYVYSYTRSFADLFVAEGLQ
jgi:dipeptidyl aminopeptidase/acylaminoacyl peptidase